MALSKHVQVFVFSVFHKIKKTRTLAEAVEKIGVWGVRLGRLREWLVPPNSVKMFASELSIDIKNTGIVNLVVQNFDFWESILGGSPGGSGAL